MVAIGQANNILDWLENLLPDDRPPRWMWHLDLELKDWFDELKQRRDEESGRPADDREEVPMWENELAKGRG